MDHVSVHRVVLAPVDAARVERLRLRFVGDGRVAAVVESLGAVALEDVPAALIDVRLGAGREPALVVDAEDLEVAVRPSLRPGWTEVRWSDEAGAWEVPTDAAADAVLGMLTRRRLVRERARPHLHGGAVVDAEGAALVVLGAAGSGKSTLLAHLAAGGLFLVNDEQVAVLADHELVTGFTRPVAVKPGGEAFLPAAAGVAPADHPQLVTAAALGARHRLAGRPALVALPDRAAGAAGVTLTALEPTEALDALAAHNLDLVDRPLAALEALAWLAATVPVVRIRYDAAADGAAALRTALAAAPAGPGRPWSVTDHGPDPARDQGLAPAPEVLSVHLGDDTVLYHRSSQALVRLSGSGAGVWRDLVEGRAIPAADPDVAAFLADLRARRLLVEGGHRAWTGMTDAEGGPE